MINTIQGMNHQTCTAFGDSYHSENHRAWSQSIMGIWEENGAGPQILTAVYSPLFDILRKMAFWQQFIVPCCYIEKKLPAFLSSMTLICVSPDPHASQSICHLDASIGPNCEGLLQAMGGTLVPDKCFGTSSISSGLKLSSNTK